MFWNREAEPAESRCLSALVIQGEPSDEHCPAFRFRRSVWAGTSDRQADVYNPATGAVTAQVALASAADVDRAVAAARAAQPAWGATPPAKRAEAMFAFRSLLKAHTEELAAMLSAEHGKTLDPTPRARWPAASRWSSSPAAFPSF